MASTIACHTNDFSQRGVGINLPEGVQVACGEQVHVSLFRDDEEGGFSGQCGVQPWADPGPELRQPDLATTK